MKTPALPGNLALMDRLHATTFATKVLNRTATVPIRRIFSDYRRRLREAERFVLDDEAVSLICHLSHERDRLPGWSFLARLPFPVVWIEFNLHTKVRTFAQMKSLAHPFNPDDVSPVVGYLCYKDGNSDSRWIAHEFKEFKGEIVPGFIAFLFDPEADGSKPVRGSETWKSRTLSRREGYPRIPVVIRSESGDRPIDIRTFADPEYMLCGLFDAISGLHQVEGFRQIGDRAVVTSVASVVQAPEWFVARGAAIIDPFWEAHFLTKKREVYEITAREVTEQAGIIRWLVTMFGTINGLPRDIKPIVTRPGRRMVGMNMLPYLEHKNLTITIPRDDRIVWARHYLDRAAGNARRRWHKVIGHWRVVELGKATGLCRHVPTGVEDGLGICERCELLIRWIEVPHGRGDLALGIVEHSYKVTGGKRLRHQSTS